MVPKDNSKIEEYKKNISLRMLGNKNPVGAKRSKKHIEIIKKANTLRCKGKPTWSSTHKEEMRIRMAGDKNPSWKGGITQIEKDKRLKLGSPELSEKLSNLKMGALNSSWQGGKSFEPYSIDWTDNLKESIRQRDNFTCDVCGVHQDELERKLHCHHIDYDKNNLNPKNLISLCNSCHMKTNFNREDWINYFYKGL